MTNVLKKVAPLAAALLAAAVPASAFAQEAAASTGSSLLPLGTGIAIGIAALGGTLGQGMAVSSALESLGRNPSASGALGTPMLLGLAFIESLVILAFVIAFSMLGKF